MTDEILTEDNEDNEVELLRWKLDRTIEEATRQAENAKQGWARAAVLQRRNTELQERIHQLTSGMTVAELRRLGVRVDLAYDEDE